MQEFYCSIGNEGIALSAVAKKQHNLPNWTTRETYSAVLSYAEQGLLCRLVYVVAGIQMDAVISLKLKVIVKYLYDINGNELPLLLYRNENEQKNGNRAQHGTQLYLGHRLLRSDRIWRVISKKHGP